MERREIEKQVQVIRRRLSKTPLDFKELAILDRKFENFWEIEQRGVI